MPLKLSSLLGVWLLALFISAALRLWGATHPDPVPLAWPGLLVLVFGPPVVLAVWLLLGWADGEGESDHRDQESS